MPTGTTVQAHARRFRNPPHEAAELHSKATRIPPAAAHTVIELFTPLIDLIQTEHEEHIARLRQKHEADARINNIRRLAAELDATPKPDRSALAKKYDLPDQVIDAWIDLARKRRKRRIRNDRDAEIFAAYKRGLPNADIAKRHSLSRSQVGRIIAKIKNAKATAHSNPATTEH